MCARILLKHMTLQSLPDVKLLRKVLPRPAHNNDDDDDDGDDDIKLQQDPHGSHRRMIRTDQEVWSKQTYILFFNVDRLDRS